MVYLLCTTGFLIMSIVGRCVYTFNSQIIRNISGIISSSDFILVATCNAVIYLKIVKVVFHVCVCLLFYHVTL